jgi:type I restriction-modification system DNA methylase subunit
MSLYQSSVLQKYLDHQNEAVIKAAYQQYTAYFHDPKRQALIRAAKEEQFQEGFLRELFVKILGYTINPDPDYDLTTELKNVGNAKKTDGAILRKGKALAVIELKGTDTRDLDKVNEQAFAYKNNQPDCVYVITSNFEKLRFFIRHAVEHEEFNLFQLSYPRFAMLWLFLQRDNLLADIPLKIQKESLLKEEEVTKRLYKDYANFKQELWQDMVKNNPQGDELLLYKKSQKLLDRFLFILFAEDKGLLPPNSISIVHKDFENLRDLDAYVPLYDRFKKYFGYMNSGFVGKKYSIEAYNGGLFKTDELLDNLTISDDVLHCHTKKLSEYDFQTEVDVNILGHIFEHSLNDIENVRAQLAGETVDKSKTKRKKDGVFYTPKYITKYIVDHTVGRLCEEKKAELGIKEEEYAQVTRKTKRATKKVVLLDKKLKDYRTWLLQITICDPACGSGAFLNQALNFLIAEHRYIDELEAQLLDAPMVFPDVESRILEQNIYGVDINEESVEIARLSLWLRTAKKGRKLNSLSDNIKVGNSLIDDPAVAGDLAFDWEKEFPKVFARGGFDVVVGNPPYGAVIKNEEKRWLSNKYQSFQGNNDVYSAFMQIGFETTKPKGIWGYINPVSWQSGEKYFELRKYLKSHGQLMEAIKLPYDVFADAFVDTGIYIVKNTEDNEYISKTYEFGIRDKDAIQSIFELAMESLPNSLWTKLDSLKIVLNPAYYTLLETIQKNSVSLGEITTSIRGILPRPEDVVAKDSENSTLYFQGTARRYFKEDIFKGVIYGDNLKEKPKDDTMFSGERILVRRLINRQLRVMAVKATTDFTVKKDIYVLKLNTTEYLIDYLTAILNSKLISYLKTTGSTAATKDDFTQLTLADIRTIPIRKAGNENQKELDKRAKEISRQFSILYQVEESLTKLIISKFNIKPSKNLQNWPSLDFKGFLAELKKKKVKLTLEEEAEWMDYFNKKKAEALALQAEIDRLDREIDEMVYDLYGLSEEERRVVEDN